MRVIYTERFDKQLAEALAYGRARFGTAIAKKTYDRVTSYIERHIAQFPRLSRYLPEIDAYESWIPQSLSGGIS